MSVDPKEYNEFIAGIQLLDIRLIAASLSTAEEPSDQSLTVDIEVAEALYSVDGDRLHVTQQLEFSAALENTPAPALSVSATFALTYHTELQPNDEILRVFSTRNVSVNVWPYFREYVQNAVARSGWPPPVLPVMKTAQRGASRVRQEAPTG